MRKRFQKMWSLLLTVCLLLSLVPYSAHAVTAPAAEASKPQPESPSTTPTDTPDAEPIILQEDVSMRGEYEKHFILSDGSYQVALYNEPVHQLRRGEWVEVDNTLTLQTSSDGVAQYATADGLTNVRFSQSFDDRLVTMANGNYAIHWGVEAVTSGLGTSTVRATSAQAAVVESDLSTFSAEEQKTMALKSSSTIQYRDALGQDVDLEYIVLPSRVKENIILNSPRDITSYVVTVYTENLIPRLLENRRIQFCNSSDEVIFTMASPYMYDSAGELSEDVAVEMVATGRDCYQIRMTPDAQWLSDKSRVYPVVIDPQVTTDSARTNIIDNYVLEGADVQNNNLDRLYIGNRSGGRNRAYVRFATMPTIPEGSIISSATLTLKLLSGTSSAYAINAYQILANWDSSTIKWSNRPSASTLVASNVGHNNLTKYSIPCTSAVQSWYNGSTSGQNANYGIMLCYYDETVSDYNAVYSADYSVESKRPSITFTYEASTTSVDVDEGATRTLTPPNVSGTITWACNDTSIATVNSSGKVTGVKAGQALVTASVGGVVQKTYTIFVTIPDSVRFIRYSGLYLTVDGGMVEGSTLTLQSKKPAGPAQYRQLWKIEYIGQHYYSIRSLYRADLALHANSNNDVDMISLDFSLSGENVPLSKRWVIDYSSSGYLFHYMGTGFFEMQPKAGAVATDTNVVVDFIPNTPHGWSFEQSPTVNNQLLLINTTNGLPAHNVFRYMDYNETASMSNLNLMVSVVSKTTNTQNVTWTSSDTSVVTVNSQSGSVTVQGNGASRIIASRDGVSNNVSFIIIIDAVPVSGTPLSYDVDLWNSSGVYHYTNCYAYILNSQYDPVNSFFGINCSDGEPRQQPGEFYNENRNSSQEYHDRTGYVQNPNLLIEAVQKDFEKYNELFGSNLIFQPIGRNEACPSGTYKVALVIAPTTANGTPDYHWYRQDPSGLWSHKQGTTQIKQVDNSEHFITDPEIANRGSYSIFVGYFAVTPWEKLYTDIVTSSYNSVALRNDSPVISINQANSIKVGMSIDEVINITGGVGTYIESESAIHQYTTSSGDSILVFYETNHTGTHVVSEVRNSSTPCS